MNCYNLNHASVPLHSSQRSIEPFDQCEDYLDHHLGQATSMASEAISPGYSEYSNATLKFIGEILLEEEEVGRKSLALKDPLVLQAAEKPFYDVLAQTYPASDSINEGESNTLFDPDSFFDAERYVSQFRPTNSTGQVSEQRGKKNRYRELGYGDDGGGGRSNKQLAFYSGDSAPAEMFDEVLLYDCHSDDWYAQAEGSNSSTKIARNKNDSDKETVDLWTLLTQCAQAVASYDQGSSADYLERIRRHSSPHGDSTQRLAHYFANGLEARLTGAKMASYTPLVNSELSSADILKAYQQFITACPFFRTSFCFANSKIRKLAGNMAEKTLHIIDFGILYGFQWPGLIQRISQRPGGPPRLRITGIELPQPGFRPSEGVEETKRRLENYCQRFNVPAEYNVIARKWETVRYEDLGIDEGRELVVVNCMYRMRHVPDETVVKDNPRDTVLRLIRRINPELFIHGVVNGTYSSPSFAARFREALHHYAGLLDMFDATVAREDPHRRMFEKAIYGRDIANVVACEGSERVERPETYRQWQARNVKAGFRQIPLDQEIFEAVKRTVDLNYNKGFTVEQHGQWLVQGWKGRRLYALSCWKPA